MVSWIAEVQAAADSERDSLGFLPQDVYRQAAIQGKLLVATSTGEYAGHLLFGGSPPTTRVFQLFVTEKYRRAGVGSRLVETLVTLAERDCCFRIIARVAADLQDASQFWERQGFWESGTSLGGKSRNRLIVIREKRLDSPTLFDLADAPTTSDHDFQLTDRSFNSSPTYGMDLNVLLDLVQDRPRAGAAARIFSAAFANTIRLFVAPEFVVELERARAGRPDLQNDTLLDFATSLPQHPLPPALSMTTLSLELGSIIFPDRTAKGLLRPRDVSDLRHLTTAVHNRVAGYITSEEAILRRRPLLFRRYGLDVIGPIELAESLVPAAWGDSPPDTARPEAFPETQVLAVDEDTLNTVTTLLAKLATPRQVVDHAISKGQLQCPRRRLLLVTDEKPAVFLSWDPPNRATANVEAFLFADANIEGRESITDQALFHLVQDVCSLFPVMIRLHIPRGATWLEDITSRFGFRAAHKGGDGVVLQKLALGRAVGVGDWHTVRSTINQLCKVQIPPEAPSFGGPHSELSLVSPSNTNLSISLLEFEELLSPAIFALIGRPGAIVPIRRQFADELLGASEQSKLFARLEAGVRGRRVYFCTPRALKSLEPGTILFFYESLKNEGRGAIVACGRSVETFIKEKPQIASHLRAQGVLGDNQLQRVSQQVSVGVLVFDSVMKFYNSVGLAKARELGCVDGRNLVTAQRIDSSKVGLLLGLGEPRV
ncbi:MAG TPA: GNAT family N-acetyltransferase [Bryobacteraceae bacterium]